MPHHAGQPRRGADVERADRGWCSDTGSVETMEGGLAVGLRPGADRFAFEPDTNTLRAVRRLGIAGQACVMLSRHNFFPDVRVSPGAVHIRQSRPPAV